MMQSFGKPRLQAASMGAKQIIQSFRMPRMQTASAFQSLAVDERAFQALAIDEMPPTMKQHQLASNPAFRRDCLHRGLRCHLCQWVCLQAAPLDQWPCLRPLPRKHRFCLQQEQSHVETHLRMRCCVMPGSGALCMHMRPEQLSMHLSKPQH